MQEPLFEIQCDFFFHRNDTCTVHTVCYLFRYRDQNEISENKKYTTDYTEMVASLMIKEATEKDTASYTCEASNDLGSVKTTGQLEVQGICQ